MQLRKSLKVVRRSLDRQAADILREQILSGAFPPGFRLVETSLAEQIHVSRGTVRGALSELAHQGLVAQIAYTKWLVPDLSPQDAWELFTLRGILEGLAARLTATTPSARGAKRLRRAFDDLVHAIRQDRRGAAAEADFGLHKTIIELSGHKRLLTQYNLIEQQVRRYIVCSDALLTDPKEIVGQHEPLVRAIWAGDADQAESLAKDHNLCEGKVLFDHLVRQADTGKQGREQPSAKGAAEPAAEDHEGDRLSYDRTTEVIDLEKKGGTR